MQHTGSAASLEVDTPLSSASLCSFNPLGFSVTRGLADSTTNAGSSLAASASQGISGSASGADNTPTNGAEKRFTKWASVNAPPRYDVDAPRSPTINDPPLVQLVNVAPSLLEGKECRSTAEEDEESGEESDCAIALHEDSFYASLIAAQQLRGQHDTTKRIGSGGAPSSSTHTSTEKSDSCDVGPLSLRSHRLRAQSAVMRASISSENGSEPPRTLQELLAWRQELLEARLREQAPALHRQQQLPSTAGLSRSLRSNASQREGSQHSSCTSLRTPGLNSPPSLSLSTRPASSHFPLASTPLQPEEHTLVAHDLQLKSEAPPTCERRHHSRPRVSLPQRRTAPQPPLENTRKAHRLTPHPFTTTDVLISTTTRQSSSQVKEEKAHLRRLLETAELLRMQDNGEGQSSFGRLCFLLLLLLFIACFFAAPFFPGGLMGIL